MAEKGNFDFLYTPIKEKMREIISHTNFITFIDNLVPVDIDGRIIVLETPTESFAKHITNTLAEKMREAILKADVGISDFRLKVEATILRTMLQRKRNLRLRQISTQTIRSTALSWVKTTNSFTPRLTRWQNRLRVI